MQQVDVPLSSPSAEDDAHEDAGEHAIRLELVIRGKCK